MGLGFAEWAKFYPNPQTKYDKIWIEGCTHNMTVQDLVDKANEALSAGGLQVISPLTLTSVSVVSVSFNILVLRGFCVVFADLLIF